MFAFCCATSTSPKGEGQVQKSHFNPIYRKLGGRKKKLSKEKVEQKAGQTYPTKKSIIYDCALSNLGETSRHGRASSELVLSICQKSNMTNEKSHMKIEKYRVNIDDSMDKSNEKELKYSRLQDKYISVLERANLYLQKELKSREKGDDKSRSKSRTDRKVRTQLQELKDRLNNIDLSGINKLAKLRTKTQNQDFSSVEDKQNKNSSAFKELRSRIQ